VLAVRRRTRIDRKQQPSVVSMATDRLRPPIYSLRRPPEDGGGGGGIDLAAAAAGRLQRQVAVLQPSERRTAWEQ